MTLSTTETRPATSQTESPLPQVSLKDMSPRVSEPAAERLMHPRMLAATVPFQALLGESLTHEY